MTKINFQNLPNTTTPINATNLNAIQEHAIENVSFTIPASSSKTLTFTQSYFAGLFTAKTAASDGNNCSLLFTYGQGGTTRTKISQLYTGSGHISFSISGQAITISNSYEGSYMCSMLCLVGDHDNFSIT